jgi:hypothetical protein
MTTNEEVAQAFANGQPQAHSLHMFIETSGDKSTIYSYGYHFPIAIRRNGILYVNKDRYSRTTSRHQSLVAQQFSTEGRQLSTEEMIKLDSEVN